MSNASFNATNRRAQYAAVNWGPGRGIWIALVTFIVAQLIAIGIIIGLAAGFGHGGHAAQTWVDSTFGQFTFVVIAESLSLGLLWLLLRKRANLKAIGFSRRPRWSDGAWAVVVGLGYFAALAVALTVATMVFHIDGGQKQELGFDQVTGHLDQLLAFVSLVVLPPLVEEILFRGVLFGGLRTKLPLIWAILITSLLFAAPHLLEANSGLLWAGGLDTFMLSIALCLLREYTGSLWASITLHTLKNGVAYMYLFIFVHHLPKG